MARVARGLPTIIAATVGRIIARWSLQEAMLQTILASAAGVHARIGRVAALQPSIDRFDAVVGELLALHGIQVRTNLHALTTRLRKAKWRRDLLAHGVWARHSETRRLGVQQTRGALNVGRSRNTKPAFVAIDRAYLAHTRRMIEEGIRGTYQLNREIVAAQKLLRQQFVQRAFQGYVSGQKAGMRRRGRR